VSKNWKLFVAHLSGFWRFETNSFPPEQSDQKNVSRQKKYGGNKWAGPPIFGFNKKIYRKFPIVYVYYQPNLCTTPVEWWAGGTFLKQRKKSSSSPRAATVPGGTN
jgi:hypothetical protein